MNKKIFKSTDSNDSKADPFVITNVIKKHNPDANVLVLTGTTTSQDGLIFLDKYNTDSESEVINKCNELRDNSDFEFLKNY